MAVVAAELMMRARGETLKRCLHDMARGAEIIVVLHVVPGPLASERGASHDDGHHQCHGPLNGSRSGSKPTAHRGPPAHQQNDDPDGHSDAQEESGDLDPLRDVEEKSKDVRDWVGQRGRRNESSERISRRRLCRDEEKADEWCHHSVCGGSSKDPPLGMSDPGSLAQPAQLLASVATALRRNAVRRLHLSDAGEQ